MYTAAISSACPQYISVLHELGFKTIEVEAYSKSDNPESSHADMQILKINNSIVLIKNNTKLNNKIIQSNVNMTARFTENTIKKFIYPDCVKLNVAVVGNYAIANFKYTDNTVKKILETENYKMINVKQGYAKCSIAVVSDEAVITADSSVYRAVSGKLDCLKISEGYITLCDRYGGFIGGASFLADKSTLAFTGDITRHPDYINIKSFCKNHRVNLLSLSNLPLHDVGGVVVF